MFKETVIERNRQDSYEEPDGELIEVLEVNPNTLTMLVRVEESGLLFDPEEYTVAEITDKVAEVDPDEATRHRLIEVEQDGKNRATALEALKNE